MWNNDSSNLPWGPMNFPGNSGHDWATLAKQWMQHRDMVGMPAMGAQSYPVQTLPPPLPQPIMQQFPHQQPIMPHMTGPNFNEDFMKSNTISQQPETVNFSNMESYNTLGPMMPMNPDFQPANQQPMLPTVPNVPAGIGNWNIPSWAVPPPPPPENVSELSQTSSSQQDNDYFSQIDNIEASNSLMTTNTHAAPMFSNISNTGDFHPVDTTVEATTWSATSVPNISPVATPTLTAPASWLPNNNTFKDLTFLDAAKRKSLPAWIRDGLEKMEREKYKQMERQRMEEEYQRHKAMQQDEDENDDHDDDDNDDVDGTNIKEGGDDIDGDEMKHSSNEDDHMNDRQRDPQQIGNSQNSEDVEMEELSDGEEYQSDGEDGSADEEATDNESDDDENYDEAMKKIQLKRKMFEEQMSLLNSQQESHSTKSHSSQQVESKQKAQEGKNIQPSSSNEQLTKEYKNTQCKTGKLDISGSSSNTTTTSSSSSDESYSEKKKKRRKKKVKKSSKKESEKYFEKNIDENTRKVRRGNDDSSRFLGNDGSTTSKKTKSLVDKDKNYPDEEEEIFSKHSIVKYKKSKNLVEPNENLPKIAADKYKRSETPDTYKVRLHERRSRSRNRRSRSRDRRSRSIERSRKSRRSRSREKSRSQEKKSKRVSGHRSKKDSRKTRHHRDSRSNS